MTAILMNEDRYKLLLIGDFAYFINVRYFINSAIIIWGIFTLFLQSLHYWKYYKNESPSYLKPLEMISGLVSPKIIGLMNREDVNEFLKKSKLMIEVSKYLVIVSTLFDFFLLGILLIINSSFPLHLLEIFWSLLFTAFGYFTVNINFSQMTYFYIICLYIKLKLRNANNSIRKYFEKKYKLTNHRMKNIMISLNSIISEINTYNNDLWSKFLMIVLISVILVLDMVLFETIFGKMRFFFKMIGFYTSSLTFLLLMIFTNTASLVSFEANKFL
jgi:hypothetical protein